MPGPSGPRLAGLTSEDNEEDSTVTPGKPSLPRGATAMTWPESLPSSDDEEEKPSKEKSKPVLKKGWSNLSNALSKMLPDGTQNRGGGPLLLRQMTGFSFISATSSAASGPRYESSEKGSVPSSGRPQLKKGASAVSFNSWKSGSSSATLDRKRRTKTRFLLDLERELEEFGERNISFSGGRVVVQPQALNDKNQSQPNRIRTARFTLLTWLPKSLFAQFQRVANIYFLLICLLVNFPFSPKDWKSKVFPFMGVILWTALKDLHEDRQRRRDDALENRQKCLVFNTASRKFEQYMWQDIFVGDVLWVRCDEVFAADMILLHAGADEAFISTVSLDGETTLKERRPPSLCEKLTEPEDFSVRKNSRTSLTFSNEKQAEEHAMQAITALDRAMLQARMGKPEVAVTDVKGSFTSSESTEECPIAWVNFLPRGCTLRNTSWVLGVVIYIGDETKTRLNTARSQAKVSNMQVYLNYCIWGLLGALVILCLFAATMSTLQEDEFTFCCTNESWVIRLGIFLITFYHVIPMSLYVVFEMLKLVLGHQVNADKQMVCPETGESALARTADLIEEMGQISFIFSDKTGTLTRNEMVFARCCIGGLDLGDFRASKTERAGDTPEGVNKVHSILGGFESAPDTLVQDVQWFFLCMAVCHSVQVSNVEDKVEQVIHVPGENEVPPTALDTKMSVRVPKKPQEKGRKSPAQPTDKNVRTLSEDSHGQKYLGCSPDEVALVEAARDVGIVFVSRQRNHLPGASASSSRVIVKTGESEMDFKSFTVLYELEFNSDRKRMSVVCRHKDEYYCITKGADSIMESLLTESFAPEYVECLKRFSQQGLRTLVIAMKKVDSEDFETWQAKYISALACLDDSKDAKVAETAAEMEQDLKLVGISAVEDRLQDGVAQAIETLKMAGVRVWVLTGDKTETAVDIARSCLLFNDQTHLAYATEADNTASALLKLQNAKRELAALSKEVDSGLVLDGKTIQYAFMDPTCKSLIYHLGLASRSCVCCRLTPLQKRQLVELVHEKSPETITLAIGDGANDVPMIEGAHLGIAVRGKEGCQAVQVSDVAISQFRFLVPLLLCHGRRAYRRIAVFLCYYLYKNVALAIGDVVWMIQDQYGGRIAFPEYLSVNYNFLFTSWHILFVLGFDEDVPDDVAVSSPLLYLEGPSRSLFNRKVFAGWMIMGVYHGIVAWIIPNLWFGGDVYDKKQPGPFWVGSCASFTIIVLIACLKLLLSSVGPLKFRTSIMPTVAAILLYAFTSVMLGYTSMGISLQPNFDGIPGEVLKSKEALLCIFAIPPACMTVDVASKLIGSSVFPTPLDRIKKPCFKF